jgi:DNA-binding transcriptional LysR family regulator
MRTEHLRQADLNLLVVFTVLAEERNVSRAAHRLLLSQPAVTRAMQRLRETFHDELLIRTSGGYQMTPKGALLIAELEAIFPKLDALLTGGAFDPAKERARFRVAGTDYSSHVIGIPLMKRFRVLGSRLSLDLLPLSDDIFMALEHGRFDLLLYADDGNIPANLQRQFLYEEDFVCVVSPQSRFKRRLTEKQYLGAKHVGVVTLAGAQTIPEQALAEVGVQRNSILRVSSFDLAMQMVVDSDLVATVPRRLTTIAHGAHAWKVLDAPIWFGSFRYVMAWHPRMNDDTAQIWLRKTVQQVCEAL